jgi:hypothetical protein
VVVTVVKIPFRGQSTVGMNLWLTQKRKLVYRRDWSWANYNDLNGHYLYSFNDEKEAVLFSLRWA